MADVFLSYSHADREAATVLRAQLGKHGLEVFWDVENLRAGDLWLNELQSAVDACGSFVVLVGRDGVRRWVGAESQAALNRYFGPHDDAERLPIFPILLDGTGPDTLPAFLRLFQGTSWDGTGQLPASLLEQIRDRKITAGEIAFEGCPFVGLDAYRPDQAQLFFGRQKETLDALACFDTRPGSPTVRWLEINGNSGSGKSSLMNAGLLPLVDQGWLWPRTGFESWLRIGPMMPGERPLEMLAQALANAFDCEMADVHERLTKSQDGLRMWLRSRLQNQPAFLLAIDQFEELFTFADPTERGAFDRLLATALEDPDCPLFVISTVRSDFLDQFEDLPRLVAARNRLARAWTLPLITTDGLHEIISGPARLASLDVSEVQTAIVRETADEPGRLPLVENALQWLWQRESAPRRRLSGRRLVDNGGVAGILSRSADQLLDGLGERREQALELLLRLVKVDPDGRRHTRQRIPFEEAVAVAGGSASGRDLIYHLAGAQVRGLGRDRGPVRLITVTGDAGAETTAGDGERWVNLIHETLMRTKGADAEGKPIPFWPTFWHYIEQHRGQAVRRDRARLLALEIEDAAANWDATGRAESGRWDEDRFQEVIREIGRSGVLVDEVVRPGPGRAFFGPFEPDEIDQLLALGADQDEAAGSGRYGDPWRLPLGHRARANLGDRLALLGDRRPGVGLGEDGLPDIAWHRIEGGNISIETDAGSVRRSVQAFWMARCPVTIDQFGAFVADCYRDGRWQLPSGLPADLEELKDRLEDEPPAHQGRYPNHPADSVSWYEAMAFCHWLSVRIGGEVRLPTEIEWQLAATGGDASRAYPWVEAGEDDEDWDPEQEPWRANTNESGLSRSTAVGLYPLGASKAGILDLAGTIWEWCRNPYDHPDGTGAGEDLGATRVVRGGSWVDDRDFARCAYRFRSNPYFRYSYVGFRVVSSSPIAKR